VFWWIAGFMAEIIAASTPSLPASWQCPKK
jgi:hypothetical protein